MQFIPIDPSSDSVIVTMPPALIASHGDFVVAASTISNDVSLFKRNADGYYEKKATVSVPGAPYEITTDGTWIAVSILGEYKSFVFQIDEDGQQTNYHEIPSEFDSASLIAPNTFVVVNFTHLKTYEYDGAKWNLIDTSAYGTPGELNYNSGSQKHRVTESTFTAVYFYESQNWVFLMQRQADKSWTLFDSFNISAIGYFPQHSTWNGNDTVVVSFGNPESAFTTYTRRGPGEWTHVHTYSWEMGYSAQSFLGDAVLLVDANNYLIGAPYNHYNGDGTSGAVVLMHRDSAQHEWEFTVEFGRFSFRRYQFGFGLVANDYDVLMYGCIQPPEGSSAFNCSFFTHPACFLDPIDVTCASPAELEQCNSLAIADLVTVNNPQCGQVQQSVPEFHWSAEGVQFNVTLTRAFVPEVTCAISMTCPLPPVTNTPASSAPSSTVPVAAPSAKVNSAASFFDAVAFVAFAWVAFLLV